MTRRRLNKTDNNAGWKSLGVEAQATTRPKEGRVVGKEKDQSDEDLERFLARIQGDPRHAELMQQNIILKSTRAEMPLQDAHALLARLRDMQERKPHQFGALVAMVKPRGAAHPAGEVSPRALVSLRKHGVVGADG